MAFEAGDEESLMVTVAVDGVVNAAPPVRLDKFIVKVSDPSVYESKLIGTSRVFCVSFAANFNVPEIEVKSQREEANPLLSVAQSVGAPKSVLERRRV